MCHRASRSQSLPPGRSPRGGAPGLANRPAGGRGRLAARRSRV